MSQTDSPKVVCPGCKTVYGWKPAVANRKILCKCGVLMRMPATAGGPAVFIEKRAVPPAEAVKRTAEHRAHQGGASSQPMAAKNDDAGVRRPIGASEPAEQLDALEVVEDEPLPALEPVSGVTPPVVKAPAKPRADAEPPDLELNLEEDPPAAPAPPRRSAPATPAVPAKPAAPVTPAEKAPAKPVEEEGGAYEIDFPAEPGQAKPVAAPATSAMKPLPGGRCPSCGTTLKGGATLCLNCGLDLETGKKMATTVVKDESKDEDAGAKVTAAVAARPGMSKMMPTKREPSDDEPNHLVTEVFVPLGLLVVGTGLIAFDSFVLAPKAASTGGLATLITGGGGYDVVRQLTKTGVQFFFSLPFLLAGLFIVAHLFGSSFGPMLPALIKLVAMSLTLIGVGHCTDSLLDIITEGFGFLADQIKFPVAFGVFWALSSWLFDMDFMEMFVLWIAVSLIPTILFALFIMSMLGL